jgi:hypothetical protein
MRIGLLIIAGLALVGFIAIAVILPQMEGTKSKEAATALIAGTEPARAAVRATAEKNGGNLSGAGKGVQLPARNDAKYGELKWVVSDDGQIRGWNKDNALEIALTPAAQGGKVSWNCKGYPMSAMPAECGGR